jgi:hypothetical protein
LVDFWAETSKNAGELVKAVVECPKCGGAVSAPGRAGGRPSRFCSEGCKGSAEAEMRRLNVLLRKFEERRGVAIIGAAERVSQGREKFVAEVRARHDCVIDELQARYDHLAGVPAARENGADA